MTTTEVCSKCNENPRADPDSNNPWCKECRAKYQREWQAMQKDRDKSRGFTAGVEAMRAHIAGKFRSLGNVTVSVQEAAQWVQREPAPKA